MVLGAAHAAAFVAGDVDRSLEATLPPPVQSSVTVIPFSFPRLAEQLGYGAGNRAPHFYQRAHDAGCDYRRATLEVLIDLHRAPAAARLRRLARRHHRGVPPGDSCSRMSAAKSAPGLDEVREAAIATMCRGDATHIDSFLWPSVVGKHVGRVASRIGRNSLQEEFWREVKERRLPGTDAPETFALQLNNNVEVGTSRVPAPAAASPAFRTRRFTEHGEPRPVRQGRGSRGRLRRAEPRARGVGGAVDARHRRRAGRAHRLRRQLEEVATRRWTSGCRAQRPPATRPTCCSRRWSPRCPQTLSSALQACDGFAAGDDDLPSLARACRALSGLSAYGTVALAIGRQRHGDLATCVARPSRAPCCASATPARQRRGDAAGDRSAAHRCTRSRWRSRSWTRARGSRRRGRSSTVTTVNPTPPASPAGCSTWRRRSTSSEIARIVGQRLSNTLEPERAAAFLAGFLEVNALVLVKNRAGRRGARRLPRRPSRPSASATSLPIAAPRLRRPRRDRAPVSARERVWRAQPVGSRQVGATDSRREGQGEAQGDERRSGQGDRRSGRPAVSGAPVLSDADRASRCSAGAWRWARRAEKVHASSSHSSGLGAGATGLLGDPSRARRARRGARRSSTRRNAALASAARAPYIPEVARRRCASSSATTSSRSSRRTPSSSKGLTQLLFEPETLPFLEKNVDLVATLISARGLIPDEAKDIAREIVREVVEELRKKLESEVRTRGVRRAAARPHKPAEGRCATSTGGARSAPNLKGWDASASGSCRSASTSGPTSGATTSGTSRSLVDQSGSMAESVVYSSVMAAIFASLDVLQDAARCSSTPRSWT